SPWRARFRAIGQLRDKYARKTGSATAPPSSSAPSSATTPTGAMGVAASLSATSPSPPPGALAGTLGGGGGGALHGHIAPSTTSSVAELAQSRPVSSVRDSFTSFRRSS